MDDALDMMKARVRAEARRTIGSQTAEAAAQASRHVCERLIDRLRWANVGGVVLVYLSKRFPAGGRDEPDLTGFIDGIRALGPGPPTLAAPRVDWDHGTMRAVALSFEPGGAIRTEVRRHGVPEPVVGPGVRQFEPQQVGVVLVPGVAFDENGGRVGRGGGFYDRFLSQWRAARLGSVRPGLDSPGPRVIGVAFDVQVLREVPRGPHDQVMDAIVTERRWISG